MHLLSATPGSIANGDEAIDLDQSPGDIVLLTVAEGATASNRRPGLSITVEDDGPGIAEDRIAHVLQRGVRGDERVQGHGIGLAIVQDIVQGYRGTLEVGASTELGGARFEVRLPPGL